jgi:hypothetical protein
MPVLRVTTRKISPGTDARQSAAVAEHMEFPAPRRAGRQGWTAPSLYGKRSLRQGPGPHCRETMLAAAASGPVKLLCIKHPSAMMRVSETIAGSVNAKSMPPNSCSATGLFFGNAFQRPRPFRFRRTCPMRMLFRRSARLRALHPAGRRGHDTTRHIKMGGGNIAALH